MVWVLLYLFMMYSKLSFCVVRCSLWNVIGRCHATASHHVACDLPACARDTSVMGHTIYHFLSSVIVSRVVLSCEACPAVAYEVATIDLVDNVRRTHGMSCVARTGNGSASFHSTLVMEQEARICSVLVWQERALKEPVPPLGPSGGIMGHRCIDIDTWQ
jgi:hypothetical protein